MSWAKIDDRANEHKKQLKAGAEACWLWTCGLMYTNRQDARDGFIPEDAIFLFYRFTNPSELATKLVEVGLWDKVEGGFVVHDFHDWNQSKEEREADLASARDRMKKARTKKGKYPLCSPEHDPNKHVCSGSGVVEDLISPFPKKPAKWHRFPQDFVPDESHIRIAKEVGTNLNYQLELIKDYEFKVAKTDPAATLRTWLRNIAKFAGERSGTTHGKSTLIDKGDSYEV